MKYSTIILLKLGSCYIDSMAGFGHELRVGIAVGAVRSFG